MRSLFVFNAFLSQRSRAWCHYGAGSLLVFSLLGLSGCAKTTTVKYLPNDFIKPNRVVTTKITTPLPTPKIVASFGMGNNPAVEKAFQHFLKTGHAQSVHGDGSETVAYSRYRRPVLACTPLQICVIELARGERINDIMIGDKVHWRIARATVGPNAKRGSPEVLVKPTAYHLATNLVITTTKRIYDIGLVSVKGAYTHLLRFYYPDATLTHLKADVAHAKEHATNDPVVATSTAVAVQHLHFDYTLSGDHPAWTPVRVFDDGDKTFIQMPPVVERLDLPVLYIRRAGQLQLMNYRYRRPYFIVDGLFQQAYLISGKGDHQVRVVITNHAFHTQ